MAKGNLFWHVPEWFGGSPATSTGIDNVGPDIIVELVNTENVAALAQDNFIVERVIGQYLIVSNDPTPTDKFLHHRMYVTMGDATTVNLRLLSSADDADTSWMYHKVEMMTVAMQNSNIGTWRGSGGSGVLEDSGARKGMFDVRVGRRVNEGESLIWHTEIRVAPANDEFHMQMWCRVLLKEA